MSKEQDKLGTLSTHDKDALLRLAADLDIENWRQMSKKELVAAILQVRNDEAALKRLADVLPIQEYERTDLPGRHLVGDMSRYGMHEAFAGEPKQSGEETDRAAAPGSARAHRAQPIEADDASDGSPSEVRHRYPLKK